MSHCWVQSRAGNSRTRPSVDVGNVVSRLRSGGARATPFYCWIAAVRMAAVVMLGSGLLNRMRVRQVRKGQYGPCSCVQSARDFEVRFWLAADLILLAGDVCCLGLEGKVATHTPWLQWVDCCRR